MLDFCVGVAFNALARTTLFVIFRILVYLGIAIVYVIATGTAAGIGAALGVLGSAAASGAFWGGLVGFGIVSAILYWAREYLLYLVKAGHIAVLVEVLEGKDIPGGRGQIDYAQGVVRERFVQTSVLFAVDQLVKGVLRRLNRMLFTVAAFVPIPGLRGLLGLATRVMNLSLTYTDEIILAHSIKTRSDNPWESGKDALILYAQNYKAMLKNAVFLMLLLWGITFGIFAVFLAPATLLAALLPGPISGMGFVVALLLAWATKAAILVEPFAFAALMQVYFKVTAGQQPDAEWDAKLSDASGQFQELKAKGARYVGSAVADGAPAS